MEWYRPAAVVLQCGGDSLSGDKLGCFNLSMKGKLITTFIFGVLTCTIRTCKLCSICKEI